MTKFIGISNPAYKHGDSTRLKGQSKEYIAWARITGLSDTILCKRFKRGWSIEKALTTPKLR